MVDSDSSRKQGWFTSIPLPLVSVIVGLLCGLIAWIVTEPIQSRELGKHFNQELERRLEIRAADTRRRFENFLQQIERATHGVAQNWRLVKHVYSSQWDDFAGQPYIYSNEPPPWLEKKLPSLGTIQPSQLIILDLAGNPREIYHHQDKPFPTNRALAFFSMQRKAIIASLWRTPYLLSWAEIASGLEQRRAFLMLIVPIDEHFLNESQQYELRDVGDISIGLFNADQQRLLSSSNNDLIGPTTRLDDWSNQYLVTSQALTRYQPEEGNIQFFTLVSRSHIKEKISDFMAFARRERLIEASVYISAFTLTFFLFSSKLNSILRRITRFSQNALGMTDSQPLQGNQLVKLETQLLDVIKQVSHDIDESHEMQQLQLRESKALKNALLDNSLDPIITIDKKGQVIEVNSTAEKIFGYARDQMLGNALESLLIHPKDHTNIRQLLTRCRQTNTPKSLCMAQKTIAVDANGNEIPTECSVMPIKLMGRTVFTVYLRDITAREKAERQIQSLAKFASENPSPVLRINLRGVIIYANIASEPLLHYWGCDRGQTLPLYWRNLVFEALKDGLNKEYEVNLGEQILSLLIAPVLELDYVNLYGRDITQVRIAEQQSRQHQSELVHVCRLSTMGEMATGLAHELNQPLAAIVNFASGCVRRIQTGQGGEAELLDAMAQITIQAERAGEIIKRLRTLVGKRPKEHSIVNLNDLVMEVASFVEYVADKHNVEIILELYRGSLPVDVDLVQIEQVLLNLVRNAIDAMKQINNDRRQLVLRTHKLPDNKVEVVVKDNGPGISPQAIEHLFDAFFSTKDSGMGMGLPISRKIIESHHGQITATSSLGEGAEFRVVLPSDGNLKLAGY